MASQPKTKSQNAIAEAQHDRLIKSVSMGLTLAQFDYTEAKADFRTVRDRQV